MLSKTKTKHTQAFTMRIPHETLADLRVMSEHTKRPIVQIVLDALSTHMQKPPTENLFGGDAP